MTEIPSSPAVFDGSDHRDPARALLLAVDLGGTKTAVALTDLDGRRLARVAMPTGSEAGIPEVMERMARAGRSLLQQVGADLSSVAAVGAVSPGVVLDDRVLLAPNNSGWETLALEQALRAAFGAPLTLVDNDVKAAGRAESRWGALAGAGTGIFLNLGTGLAAAIVVDGQVIRGAHGASGEFGYQLTGRDGERPFADGGAPLEELTGGRGLAHHVSATVGRPVTAAEAFALAASDAGVASVVADALDLLGRHVANLAIAIDPDVVAVGGGMLGSADAILPVLGRHLERAVPFPPRLELAHFGRDSALAGAVLLAVDAVRSARRP